MAMTTKTRPSPPANYDDIGTGGDKPDKEGPRLVSGLAWF